MPRAAEFFLVLTLIISDFYSITASMLRFPLPFLLLFSCFYCHTAHTSSTQRQRGTDPAFREFRVSQGFWAPPFLLSRTSPREVTAYSHSYCGASPHGHGEPRRGEKRRRATLECQTPRQGGWKFEWGGTRALGRAMGGIREQKAAKRVPAQNESAPTCRIRRLADVFL